MGERSRGSLRRAAQETLAMGLLGDGLVAATMPRRHLRVWEFGPRWMRRSTRTAIRRPWIVRAVALTEATLAAFWIWRLTGRSSRT